MNSSILVDEMEEPKRVGPLKRAYDKTAWLWIFVIVIGLVVQCLRSVEMSHSREAIICKLSRLLVPGSAAFLTSAISPFGDRCDFDTASRNPSALRGKLEKFSQG